jgi:hypothetical protein
MGLGQARLTHRYFTPAQKAWGAAKWDKKSDKSGTNTGTNAKINC